MVEFEYLSNDDLYGIDGGSALLTATYIVVKTFGPKLIKIGITAAGAYVAQKVLDKIFD